MDVYWFIVGLFIGSFLNVLADRLPKGRNVISGRSQCEYCKKSLRWFELIPVVSYAIQVGRCRRCHKKLSLQYPLAELCTGAGYFLLYTYFGNSWPQFSVLLIIFSAFFVMTVADLKYQIIPDSMVLIAAVGVIAMHLLTTPASQFVPFAVSSLGTGIFFYALWYFTHGRGMGFGDVKLSFVLGLFLGYPLTIIALYIAFLTGALVGVILILKGSKTLKSKIAFGPFLLMGTSITFVFQTYVLHLWNTLF